MKYFWITLLTLISNICVAHPGHGSHDAIIASGEYHPWMDYSGMLLLFIFFITMTIAMYKKFR